ncbi:hypothetical protein SMICM304S_03934 [Streptomyces microflavus]
MGNSCPPARTTSALPERSSRRARPIAWWPPTQALLRVVTRPLAPTSMAASVAGQPASPRNMAVALPPYGSCSGSAVMVSAHHDRGPRDEDWTMLIRSGAIWPRAIPASFSASLTAAMVARMSRLYFAACAGRRSGSRVAVSNSPSCAAAWTGSPAAAKAGFSSRLTCEVPVETWFQKAWTSAVPGSTHPMPVSTMGSEGSGEWGRPPSMDRS